MLPTQHSPVPCSSHSPLFRTPLPLSCACSCAISLPTSLDPRQSLFVYYRWHELIVDVALLSHLRSCSFLFSLSSSPPHTLACVAKFLEIHVHTYYIFLSCVLICMHLDCDEAFTLWLPAHGHTETPRVQGKSSPHDLDARAMITWGCRPHWGSVLPQACCCLQKQRRCSRQKLKEPPLGYHRTFHP